MGCKPLLDWHNPYYFPLLPRKVTLAKGYIAKAQLMYSLLLQEATAHKNGLVLICSAKEIAPFLQCPPRLVAFEHRARELARPT